MIQLQHVSLQKEWQWIKPRALPGRRQLCCQTRLLSLQSSTATISYISVKHTAKPRNDHAAEVKHPTSLTLTAKPPKKNHSVIKVENVSSQTQDVFIFSCLPIKLSQNTLTVSLAYIIHFCPQGHHSAFCQLH